MKKLILILLCLLLLVPEILFASEDETRAMVASLNEQINSCSAGKSKAKLFLYRARQHAILNDRTLAMKDYQAALQEDYTGWIANEYAHFLYNCGEYEQAYNAAGRVIKEFPHLKNEAERLREKAEARYREVYNEQHPPTIVMDVQVDPNRKSRHDLMRPVRQTATSSTYASITQSSSSAGSKTTATKAKTPTRRS